MPESLFKKTRPSPVSPSSSPPRSYLGVVFVKRFLLPCGGADAVRRAGPRVAAGTKVSSTVGVPTGCK
jgi:hypothetical protein